MRLTTIILALCCACDAVAAPAATRATTAPTLADARADVAAAMAKLDALASAPPALTTLPPRPVYSVEAGAAALAPWVRPFSHPHVSRYADYPTRRPPGTNTLKIPRGNLQWLARAARDGGTYDVPGVGPVTFAKGAPLLLDWEGPEFADLRNLPTYVEYAKVVRAEAPGLTVGVNFAPTWYGLTFETWVAGPSAEQLAKLDRGIEQVRPLADACDFVVAGMYLSAPEAIERDLAGYRAAYDWARWRYGGKPFYAYLHPHWQYHKSPTWKDGDGWTNRTDQVPLDPASARRVFDLAMRYDAAVCWPFAGEFLNVVKGQER